MTNITHKKLTKNHDSNDVDRSPVPAASFLQAGHPGTMDRPTPHPICYDAAHGDGIHKRDEGEEADAYRMRPAQVGGECQKAEGEGGFTPGRGGDRCGAGDIVQEKRRRDSGGGGG